MKLTGRDGVLRILDSSDIIADGSSNNMSVYVYDDSLTSFTDKTSEAYVDDTNVTGNLFEDSGDKVYVGFTRKFARIKFLSGDGTLGVGCGGLTVKYYNGSTFTSVSGLSDGTSSGGDTFASDGVISFKIPKDWELRGNANLDSDKYYVELSVDNVPSTPPSADVLAPVDGQYFEVIFANMDFSGPIARPKTNEILVLNRGTMDSNAHYIEDTDSSVYEPLQITFSAVIDDTVNREYLEQALQCGSFNDSNYWTTTGVSTKGDTKNDGTNNNPVFRDSSKKCVNVMILWQGSTNDIGYAFYETYFPPEQISISEAEDGVTLTANGFVYGVIERISAIANRY